MYMQYFPSYPLISSKNLLPGDVLLFYGFPHGNRLTEWHGRHRRAELGRMEHAPFHAAMVYEHMKNNVLILDPEVKTGASLISEYTKKEHIIIQVIRYPLTEAQMSEAISAATQLMEEEGWYDVKGYGFFISQMPYMGWIKKIPFIQPSNKEYFCSDAVTYCLQERAGVKISEAAPNNTAPIDLILYAGRTNNQIARIYILKKG